MPLNPRSSPSPSQPATSDGRSDPAGKNPVFRSGDRHALPIDVHQDRLARRGRLRCVFGQAAPDHRWRDARDRGRTVARDSRRGSLEHRSPIRVPRPGTARRAPSGWIPGPTDHLFAREFALHRAADPHRSDEHALGRRSGARRGRGPDELPSRGGSREVVPDSRERTRSGHARDRSRGRDAARRPPEAMPVRSRRRPARPVSHAACVRSPASSCRGSNRGDDVRRRGDGARSRSRSLAEPISSSRGSSRSVAVSSTRSPPPPGDAPLPPPASGG